MSTRQNDFTLATCPSQAPFPFLAIQTLWDRELWLIFIDSQDKFLYTSSPEKRALIKKMGSPPLLCKAYSCWHSWWDGDTGSIPQYFSRSDAVGNDKKIRGVEWNREFM